MPAGKCSGSSPRTAPMPPSWRSRVDRISRSTCCRRDRDLRLHVLLRDPRAVLLHPPPARQARVRGKDPHPAMGDHLVPADLDRLGGRDRGAARALARRMGGRGARPRRARRAHPAHPGGGHRRRGPEQGPPDGGRDRQQRHPAGVVRPDRAAGLSPAGLGRLPDLSGGGRRSHPGLPRHAGPSGPWRAARGRGPVPRRGDQRGARRRGEGRAVRRAGPDPDAGRREPGGASDPLRRRAARDRGGGPSQAAHLRHQGPHRAEHAGQPDRDGHPHRRAPPTRCSVRSSRSASR